MSNARCFPVTVDTVIFTLVNRDLKVCLTRRDDDHRALPGGGLSANEGLEEAAQRHLEATLGVSDAYIQQLYTFSGQAENTPVISVAYFMLISADCLPREHFASTDGPTAWHSVYALPPLSAEHANILNYALQRLRYKIEYSAVAFELLPETFTLRELQDAYMIILDDHRLDKANFRKKIREANIVEAVSSFRETGGRPAQLYRFRKDAQLETKARRFFP